jgi:4-hydroxythreonine-4-phosphate dehydrogenase
MKRILITPGEPAGIGPDITIALAQHTWECEIVAIADPDLLLQRAKQLGLPLQLRECNLNEAATQSTARGHLHIIPVKLIAKVQPGQLNVANARYVIDVLEIAAGLCLQKNAHAVVTGPVHKAVVREAGIAFTGHTEFFADYCHVPQTVMLFVAGPLKVALATTHLPLSAVSAAITAPRLHTALTILHDELQRKFALSAPRILVCGLNPHAGEGGHFGREEIEVIAPVIQQLQRQQCLIEGPLPADTIFTPQQLQRADAVLAMYHDQALPLVKYIGFGHAVNVTLGLPFIRTSVDHGTALDSAGTGRADPGSLLAALQLALDL